jgi:integrating conjugative element protein (TIGR03757 family)
MHTSPVTFIRPAHLCWLALLFTLPACAETWVITDRQHPVTGAYDRLIELDAPERLETTLTKDLPADPERAARLLQARLQPSSPLQKELVSAYQGVTDAWQRGIGKIPAVVVDQRYMVYGEADVAKAEARIAAYRRQHP